MKEGFVFIWFFLPVISAKWITLLDEKRGRQMAASDDLEEILQEDCFASSAQDRLKSAGEVDPIDDRYVGISIQ
ncbi:hypothetical protein [Salinarimonas ramus]|uniref:hypothetical protein n=1 Tax=Salinarimonas ramus TaxID=690164 RepID=UPI001665C4D8|nr:hypothetical protein [Salinarimonas ramus]